VTTLPGIAQDLKRVVPMSSESFEALRLGGREVIHPLVLSHGSPNSDFFPVLDLGADRMRFMRESAEGYTGLTNGRFDVVAALSGRRAGFGSIGVPAVPEVGRPSALALGTRLRAMRTLPSSVTDQIPRDEELRGALYRLDQLDRVMAIPRPPADWHSWMQSVVDVDADIHGGTAGVVDTAFFASVRRFAASQGAPVEARAAVEFLHGIGAWDWPKAAIASEALIATTDSVQWIPETLLRNGAAVSYVMLGDTAGATGVLRTFARRTSNDRFRESMIASYLVYQDTVLRRRRGWQ
jgi:hypothetical protein